MTLHHDTHLLFSASLILDMKATSLIRQTKIQANKLHRLTLRNLTRGTSVCLRGESEKLRIESFGVELRRMRATTLLSLVFAPLVGAFVPLQKSHFEMSSMKMSTETSPEVFSKPPRVVLEDLPVLYVYDHCPFCVRVRFALGLKNIKHTLQFMANDDVPTPTKLVGKKIAPIFELPGKVSGTDIIMPESMDIINLLDSDSRFGPTGMVAPASGRTDLKDWQKSVQSLLRTLQRPRYVATGLLPEFQQLDGRHAFIKNHQLPPYEKAEWKGDGGMSMEDKLKIYAEAMASDPAPLIEELNAKLVELADIVYSEHSCSEGGLSMDDIDLWARLRSITIIKGVQWPSKLRAYMDNLSEIADIPLYDEMAM